MFCTHDIEQREKILNSEHILGVRRCFINNIPDISGGKLCWSGIYRPQNEIGGIVNLVLDPCYLTCIHLLSG
jgi:hypothetical protein